jgi:hypothetical protein
VLPPIVIGAERHTGPDADSCLLFRQRRHSSSYLPCELVRKEAAGGSSGTPREKLRENQGPDLPDRPAAFRGARHRIGGHHRAGRACRPRAGIDARARPADAGHAAHRFNQATAVAIARASRSGRGTSRRSSSTHPFPYSPRVSHRWALMVRGSRAGEVARAFAFAPSPSLIDAIRPWASESGLAHQFIARARPARATPRHAR